MKNLSKLSLIVIFAILVSGVFTFSSCKKKSAPAIPPESTFVLQNIDGDTTAKSHPEFLYQNFGHAALKVGFWTAISSVALIVPVTAYQKALEQDPQHVEGTKWVWEFQFGVGFNIYTVQLFGETLDDKVEWELHVSLPDVFDDFVWYTGTHDLDGTEGQWILYKSPSEDVPFIQIDWTHNDANNTGTIKYTNIEPEGTENGGYIFFGNGQDGDYDAFYDIYNKGIDNLTEIEFNTTANNGRIKSPNFYFDDAWHCWNEQFLDDYCNDPAK